MIVATSAFLRAVATVTVVSLMSCQHLLHFECIHISIAVVTDFSFHKTMKDRSVNHLTQDKAVVEFVSIDDDSCCFEYSGTPS